MGNLCLLHGLKLSSCWDSWILVMYIFMYDMYFLYRIFMVHLLIVLNILFHIFSIYNLNMSIANLTRIPNDSSIHPIIILYTYYISINLGQPMYVGWTTFFDSCPFDKCLLTIVNTSFCIMYSVCICSWWWVRCIYFVSSVVFVDFLIKSSFKKRQCCKMKRAKVVAVMQPQYNHVAATKQTKHRVKQPTISDPHGLIHQSIHRYISRLGQECI